MKRKKRSVSRAGATQLRESSELPGLAQNSASLTVRGQLAKRRAMRAGVYVIVWVLVPLAAISCIMMVTNQVNQKSETQVTSGLVNSSLGKGAAIGAVNDWLAMIPSPLPGGDMVSWDGFETITPPPPDPNSPNDKAITYLEERHFFTLRAGGTMFDSQVLVLSDGDRGVKTVGTPTLMPRPAEPSSDWFGEVPWFGFSSATASPEAITEVERWAEAFASGSPKKLKSQVGDPNAANAYVPLSGVAEVIEVKVVTAASRTPPETTTAAAENIAPTEMIVRVELLLAWEGQEEPLPGERLTPVTFDLLLTGIDTSAPKVVSWGGVGSGPDLEPYSVGLKGVKLSEPQLGGADHAEPSTDETGVEADAFAAAASPTQDPAIAPMKQLSAGGH